MDSTWHGRVGDRAGTDPRPLAGVTLQPNRRDQPFSLLPSSRQQPWAAGRHRETPQLLTPLNRANSHAANLQHPQFWGGAGSAPCPSAPLEWDLEQSHPAIPALPAAPFRIPAWAGPAALLLPPPPRAAFQLLLNSVQAGFITRALKRLQTNRKSREQERAERSIGAGGA